jgi:hypothetical protein
VDEYERLGLGFMLDAGVRVNPASTVGAAGQVDPDPELA